MLSITIVNLEPICEFWGPEVGIYKRKILRKKGKHAFAQEKKEEITILTKKARKKTRNDQRKF